MSDSLYITGNEAKTGKSAILLGIMEMLERKISRVGFFRPIIADSKEDDPTINLMSTYFNLPFPYEKMYGIRAREATELVALGKQMDVVESIIKKYNELKEMCDFILCDGTNYASATAAYEFEFNCEISKNLSSPVLLVVRASGKSEDQILGSVELALESLRNKKCQVFGTIVNRIQNQDAGAIMNKLKENPLTRDQLLFTIPDNPAMDRPTLGEVAKVIGAEVLCGEVEMSRHIHTLRFGSMEVQNLVSSLARGTLVITSGDRVDMIMASLAVSASAFKRSLAGIVLTGNYKLDRDIMNLILTSPKMVPVLTVADDAFQVATKISRIHTTISPTDSRKITELLAMFDRHLDTEKIEDKLVTTRQTTVTPKMFEFSLIKRARKHKQRVVLPEGDEERILRAVEILSDRDVADLVILGDIQIIRDKIDIMGLRMGKTSIIDPEHDEMFEDYVQTYYDLRKHKGITLDNARDVMRNRNFFATMMVYKGHADAMVSGSVHSTAETIRPALQIIRTKPGFSIVSSVFLMCLEDRVLVYGDCAVNPDPNAEELAEIALSSAQTAKTFGIDPLVAMLSYSTGTSGTGADVDKVREAARIAKEKAATIMPGLKIEGPIQYDAAVDMAVAKTKLPDSEVAGKATVFIFPDLNTGNNTYKAVQRSADAVAIGPVLQGLRFPVNDLSRGCTVPDIVNTVAMTAIQAQFEKGIS